MQFYRLLICSLVPVPATVEQLARDLAVQFGLRETPSVYRCTASIASLVWWVGGQVRVVLPASVLQQFGRQDLRMVLAHEFAHIRRKDHWVRWLEWFRGASRFAKRYRRALRQILKLRRRRSADGLLVPAQWRCIWAVKWNI